MKCVFPSILCFFLFLTLVRIFRNGTNFEKDHVFYTCADNDGSIFSLSNRDEHRARRKALSPRFSKKAAEADAPAILNQIKLLEAFMIRHSSLGKSCNVSDLFRAFGVSYYTLAWDEINWTKLNEDQYSGEDTARWLWRLGSIWREQAWATWNSGRTFCHASDMLVLAKRHTSSLIVFSNPIAKWDSFPTWGL